VKARPVFLPIGEAINLGMHNGKVFKAQRADSADGEVLNMSRWIQNKNGKLSPVTGFNIPIQAAEILFAAMTGGNALLPNSRTIKTKPQPGGMELGDLLLIKIGQGITDTGLLAEVVYPGDERGRDKVRAQVARLRNRSRWLDGWTLTSLGEERLRELRSQEKGDLD